MKTSNPIGRREMLATLAAATLTANSIPTNSFAEHAPSSEATLKRILVQVQGHSHRPVSGHSRVAAEVRAVLEEALALGKDSLAALGKNSAKNGVSDVLAQTYGTSASEIALGPHYAWVWVGDGWRYVCFDNMSFEIALGSREVIEVLVDEGTILR